MGDSCPAANRPDILSGGNFVRVGFCPGEFVLHQIASHFQVDSVQGDSVQADCLRREYVQGDYVRRGEDYVGD